MSTRHLVDPQLLPMLDTFLAFEFSREALPGIRAARLQMLADQPAPPDPGASVAEERIPGPPGAPDVRVLIYRPRSAQSPAGAFLHMHGGGYMIGAPEMADPRNRTWAQQAGCVIVSVDYRLAPETSHPGPLEDCYAALKWLHANAARLGVDPRRIAIGGESAGGGLSAGLALLARDRGEIPIAFQLLIYPMIDDRTGSTGPTHPYAGEFIWSAANNRFGWQALLGCEPGSTGVSPYAAAARAENLAGLPRAFISTGALDLFVEEDIEYARRLLHAGVPTELHVYPGAFHGFERALDADVTRNAQRDALNALTLALRGLAT